MNLLDNNSMPHTLTHLLLRYERDDDIGNREIDIVQTTGIPGWVQNASDVEVLQYQKRDQLVTHKVYFATSPTIETGSILTVTAGPSFVGTRLEVVAFTDRSAGLGLVTVVMCKEGNN